MALKKHHPKKPSPPSSSVVSKPITSKSSKKIKEKAGRELTLGIPCEGWETSIKKPKQTKVKRAKKKRVKTKGDEVEEYSVLNELQPERMKCLLEGVMKKRLSGIENGKLKALKERWRSLKKAELELFVQRMDLIHEQVKLVLDSLKKRR